MTSDKPLEPIEITDVRVYGCPICPERVIGTLEEAREHVRIPLSSGLVMPRGFTFGYSGFGRDVDRSNNDYFIIYVVRESKLVTRRATYMLGLTLHDFNYQLEGYRGDTWDYSTISWSNSGKLVEQFRHGQNFILNHSEFDDFLKAQKKLGPESYKMIHKADMRDSPKIEELIRTSDAIDTFLANLEKKK